MDNTIVKNSTSQGIDKTAIKNFAVYARNKLIKDIKNKAAMIGVTENGIQEPLSTSTGNIQLFDIGVQEPYRIEGKAIEQRNGLTRELKKRAEGSTYKTAYETLIEEVAYTWFNRIIAIRFMEVNNYMPDRMRILSSGVEGINEPEFITHVFETNFEFNEEEKERIIELKTDGSNLAMDELFQYLFIKQCNALNANLPELFEKTNDYTELLLTVSYNDIEGVINKLVHEVPEANFDVNSDTGNGQVEIIGWLYQFYNTEPKATVFSRPKTKKIKKQDIPAATQLFTPEWIVKYMVENTLGRLWVEKLLANDDSRTEKQIADDFGWRYYLLEAEQEEDVEKQLEILRNKRKDLSVEDITFLDPSMGSFHIGIYAFDVFMQLYESEGYTAREAARIIVEKNLHGLDIDKRAAQLSYFASMMQARKHNRRILEESLQPNVYEIPESNHINREHLDYLGNDNEDKEEWSRLKLQLVSLLNNFIDAKEYGSLMNISDKYEFSKLRKFVVSHPLDSQISLLETMGLEDTQKELIDIINTGEVISKKYQIVITNPPYMSNSGMDKKLSGFAKKYYPSSKSDMFAMFIEKCENYTVKNGYFSMITQHAWMFLSSYEKLRSILLDKTLVNMAHLGTRAFEDIAGEVVQTTSFVYLNNNFSNHIGKYIKLTDFDSQTKKEVAFLDIHYDKDVKSNIYENNKENYRKVPGKVMAYWITPKLIASFNYPTLETYGSPKQGMIPGNTNEFLRLWFEVHKDKIGFNHTSHLDISRNKKKWFPYAKGGSYRKWAGNNEYVINMEDNGHDIKFSGKNNNYRLRDSELYFKEALTWSKIGSGKFSMRFLPPGNLFDIAGCCIFYLNDNINYILGFTNSIVTETLLSFISPTLNFEVDHIKKLPIKIESDAKAVVDELVERNVLLSSEDWNMFETSWEFKRNPLLNYHNLMVESAIQNYMEDLNNRIEEMMSNEEKINHTFLKLYDLNSELAPTVSLRDITITRVVTKKTIEDKNNSYVIDKAQVIKNYISYAVGCMFGRYSLDSKGLVNTGGDLKTAKYNTFMPIQNNIVHIGEDKHINSNIVNEFVRFVEISFGKEQLEENLHSIAQALDNKGTSSREVISNYFSNDFYKDHLKMYQKRPIYWLYDSGKQNGFKALIYMHRYDEDTTGKVRVNYLHQVQRAYERTIANLQEDIADSKDAKETTRLQKQLEKVTKQLKECRDYDERLGHIALERVAIDLDDGVKVNYEKVQTDSEGKFHQILAKIK